MGECVQCDGIAQPPDLVGCGRSSAAQKSDYATYHGRFAFNEANIEGRSLRVGDLKHREGGGEGHQRVKFRADDECIPVMAMK